MNDVAVVSIQGASGNAGAILGQYDITASRGWFGSFVIGDESAAGQTQVANANQLKFGLPKWARRSTAHSRDYRWFRRISR